MKLCGFDVGLEVPEADVYKILTIIEKNGGNDNADQKAACADSEKIESSQLFDNARRVMRQR